MMFPAFEHILGPLSEDEAKQSSKFVKFLFEFAVRGHPKQDSKYEFKEWKEVKDGQITHFVFGKYSGSQIGLPFQHRMKWWNALPVYWKKNTAPPLEVEVEDPGKVPDEVCQQQPTVEEGSRYAENVEEISDTEEIIAEELTKEELEELQVVRVIDQLKEEL